MPNYRPAPAVEKVARELISEHHQHLINRKIVYIFRDSPQKRAGTEVWGKARKVGGLSAFLSAYAGDELDLQAAYDEELDPSYFVIEIAEPIWDGLDDDARRALVDHELSHCDVHISDSGHVSLRIIPHNLEEFTAVVRRHGLWKSDLRRFAKVTNEQLELDVELARNDGEPDEDEDEPEGEERHLQPVAAATADTPF